MTILFGHPSPIKPRSFAIDLQVCSGITRTATFPTVTVRFKRNHPRTASKTHAYRKEAQTLPTSEWWSDNPWCWYGENVDDMWQRWQYWQTGEFGIFSVKKLLKSYSESLRNANLDGSNNCFTFICFGQRNDGYEARIRQLKVVSARTNSESLPVDGSTEYAERLREKGLGLFRKLVGRSFLYGPMPRPGVLDWNSWSLCNLWNPSPRRPTHQWFWLPVVSLSALSFVDDRGWTLVGRSFGHGGEPTATPHGWGIYSNGQSFQNAR